MTDESETFCTFLSASFSYRATWTIGVIDPWECVYDPYHTSIVLKNLLIQFTAGGKW